MSGSSALNGSSSSSSAGRAASARASRRALRHAARQLLRQQPGGVRQPDHRQRLVHRRVPLAARQVGEAEAGVAADIEPRHQPRLLEHIADLRAIQRTGAEPDSPRRRLQPAEAAQKGDLPQPLRPMIAVSEPAAIQALDRAEHRRAGKRLLEALDREQRCPSRPHRVLPGDQPAAEPFDAEIGELAADREQQDRADHDRRAAGLLAVGEQEAEPSLAPISSAAATNIQPSPRPPRRPVT